MVTAVTGLTTTSTRVYESRVLPLTATDLPALCVYTRIDTPNYSGGTMPRKPQRMLEVHVEGFVDGDDQSVMDDIAAEVETAVFANAVLLALVGVVALGEQEMRVDAEGVDLVSVIDMCFNVSYSTTEGVPGTVLRG